MPVIVREVDDKEALELAIIENVQRADLNPLEEALGYGQLIEQFDYTQQDLAQVRRNKAQPIRSRPHTGFVPHHNQDRLFKFGGGLGQDQRIDTFRCARNLRLTQPLQEGTK